MKLGHDDFAGDEDDALDDAEAEPDWLQSAGLGFAEDAEDSEDAEFAQAGADLFDELDIFAAEPAGEDEVEPTAAIDQVFAQEGARS